MATIIDQPVRQSVSRGDTVTFSVSAQFSVDSTTFQTNATNLEVQWYTAPDGAASVPNLFSEHNPPKSPWEVVYGATEASTTGGNGVTTFTLTIPNVNQFMDHYVFAAKISEVLLDGSGSTVYSSSDIVDLSVTLPCFLPGTRVLLAGGATAAIETLDKGAFVATADGRNLQT